MDACVLYPVSVADALMSVAVTGLFAPKWTTEIEAEWMGNLEAERPDLVGRLSFRRDNMREAIPDWEISEAAWRPLVGSLTLPDPDDVHVLAAAIVGHADCIVTANLKDFPNDVLAGYDLTAVHPDDFLVAQLDLDEIAALTAFKAMRARSKRPPFSPEEFADVLERNGLAATAERLREAAALI
ncbi:MULTISPECIES: PIN domain-containing protein [Comamonadaceae]|uniref:PIN domain-containing protein n=1 Tax=Comamonadaceae TaxID=80864 RepID=UPI001E331C24|nr:MULTISPECIES: PIN domain-containing protein [Comamonadaceae]